MDAPSDITQIKEFLDGAKEILIATGEHPTFDSIGSVLSLYLGLQSIGKKVTVICADPVTVGLSNFVGANKITTAVSNKNFVISLDYVDGSIEKVSYNIEGNKFNLVIEPRAGYEGFSEDKVHYTHAGAAADLIFVVDTRHMTDLGKIYEDHKDIFSGKPIVNIDRHADNALFGKINIVDPQASATVELVSQVLSMSGVRLTEDIATNVLNALYDATNSFTSPTVSPRAFELAAACMKAGGRRFTKVTEREEIPVLSSEPMITAPQPTAPTARPVSVPTPVSAPVASPAVTPAAAPVQAPPDWLKPKIYKSSTLL